MSTILAIDPSSTCTGYAVMRPIGHTRPPLVECGKLKPHRAKDDANARIDAMVEALGLVIADHAPDLIVIEDTSGKVSGRHGGGGGAGLAIHGKAIGRLHQAALAANKPVRMVAENLWTRGQRKATRTARVAALYVGRGYDPAQDKGGDVADAIGLGMWLIVRESLEEGRAEP